MNLMTEIIENIKYEFECRQNENDDIDWNFVLGLFFGICYLIFV